MNTTNDSDKSVRTNLFQFATLRAPKLIENDAKSAFFITHPNSEKSHFLQDLSKDLNTLEVREILLERMNSFESIDSKKIIRSTDESLYDFSIWLMHNKDYISVNELKTKIKGVTSLTDKTIVLIWDNIFAQTLKSTSPSVLQASIQMLLANHFITSYKNINVKELDSKSILPNEDVSYNEEDILKAYFIRLANSKLLLPDLFSQKATAEKNPVNLWKDLSGLEEILRRDFVLDELQNIKKAKNEFLEYHVIRRAAYTKQLDAHNKAIEKLSNKKRSRISVPKHPGAFEFLSVENLPTTFSNWAIKYVQTLPIHTIASFKKLNNTIEKLETTLFQEQSEIAKKRNNQVFFNGAEIKSAGQDTAYCFSILGISNFLLKQKFLDKIGIVINTTYNGAQIVNSSFNVSNSSNTTSESNPTITVVNNSSHLLKLIIQLPANKIDITTDSKFIISGTFELDNGTKLKIDFTGTAIGDRPESGCTEVIKDEQPNKVNLYGITNVGVADFKRVEQEVCCYVAGDVSHIENIMAREYKERSTRNLTRSENTKITSSETEQENLTDTTTSERNEMQSEVNAVLETSNSQNYGGSVGVATSMSYGAGPISATVGMNANAYADFANSTSSSQSNKQSQKYAEEVTERVLDRLLKKISTKRTSKVIKEFEENNKHGFDNREGDNHVSGVYRWIDKIYTNRIVNYGKRLTYEFMIPEPSKFFKNAMLNEQEGNSFSELDIVKIQKPVSLKEQLIIDANDINSSNYLLLAAQYGAEVEPMPELDIVIGIPISVGRNELEHETNAYAVTKEIEIPEGYYAQGDVQATWNGIPHFSSGSNSPNGGVIIGNVKHSFFDSNGNYNKDILSGHLHTLYSDLVPVPVSFTVDNFWAFEININIRCKLSPIAIEQWKIDTYLALSNAYDLLVQDYNDQVLAYESGGTKDQTRIKFNPLLNRAIEKREIKRLCIEMLTRPFGFEMGGNFYNNSNCVPEVIQTAEMEYYSSYLKFIEQAFDWEVMGYLFYPYYWANKNDCHWKDLLRTRDDADPIFQGFLQSGFSRVTVPVRPQFEEAVLLYMDTGIIWNGGSIVLDMSNDLYVSIIDELQVPDGVIGEEWETRVPTSLNIIQKGSAGLDETGLPCCHEDDTPGTITASNTLIGAKDLTVAGDDDTTSNGSGSIASEGKITTANSVVSAINRNTNTDKA